MLEFVPQYTPTDVDTFTAEYLDTAEWLLDDELHDSEDCNGWAPETVTLAKADCDAFRGEADSLLKRAYAREGYGGEEQAAHDFWLTRNGHGVGFWDREALAADGLGDALSAVARRFRSLDAYQGDDGFLYLS